MIWQDLGVSGGTAIIVLITLYFIIKWGVKNGIKAAYKEITGGHASRSNKILEETLTLFKKDTHE